MSKIVEIKELRRGDVFALPNGSVYEVEGPPNQDATPRARMWCAHPPDAITFDPPSTEFPLNQKAHHLTGQEMKDHAQHEGYVKRAFNTEMDRRNDLMMQSARKRGQLVIDEQQRVDQAARPWWKKIFA